MDDTRSRIRTFIAEELLFEDANAASSLTDEAPVLPVIDSLGLTQLVAFLEEDFEIEVDDAEITADNFRTVADIARLVDSKSS